MYKVFQMDGFDYCGNMMPTTHNYITVETPTFLYSPDYMMAEYNMLGDRKEGPEIRTLSGSQRCSGPASSGSWTRPSGS